MWKDVHENDYTEYKLVRINKKQLNTNNKKKISYHKSKDKRYRNNESNYTIYNNDTNYNHINDKYKQRKKLDKHYSFKFNDDHYSKNINSQYDSLEDNRMACESKDEVNKETSSKYDGRSKLSFSKFHRWNLAKLELKNANSKQANHIKSTYKTTPIQHTHFNNFYSNFFYMMQPVIPANKMWMNDFYNKYKSENSIEQIFLNYNKSYLNDLYKHLQDEARSNISFSKDNLLNRVVCKNDLNVVAICKRFSDLSNDVQSNSTNEDITFETKGNSNMSLYVIVQISINEVVKQIKIKEDSDVLEIVKQFCKKYNLNEKIIFSIYKKIKSAMNTLVEYYQKSDNFKIKKSRTTSNLPELSL